MNSFPHCAGVTVAIVERRLTFKKNQAFSQLATTRKTSLDSEDDIIPLTSFVVDDQGVWFHKHHSHSADGTPTSQLFGYKLHRMKCLHRPGVSNMRPAGLNWSAKWFNLVCLIHFESRLHVIFCRKKN